MIPYRTCQICNKKAEFLCHHPDCEADPFLCMSTCINNASQLIHIHLKTSKSKTISLQNLFQRINTIQQGPYKTYFKDNGKSFDQTVASVKRIFDTQKYTLQQNSYNLSEWIKPKIQALKTKTGTPLCGKQINKIINVQDIYSNFNHNKFNNRTSKLQKFKKDIDALVKNYYQQDYSNKTFDQFFQNNTKKPFSRLKRKNIFSGMKFGSSPYQQFDYCNKNQFSNHQNDQSDSMNNFIDDDEGIFQQKPHKTFSAQKQNFSSLNLKNLIKIAQQYHDQQNYIKAEQYYDKCLSINENNVQALNGKGVLKLDESKYLQALHLFNRLVDLIQNVEDQDQIDSDYYFNRALTQFQLHNYHDSQSNLKKAIKFIKSSKQKGDYFHLRAKIYLNQNKYSEALTECDQAIMRLEDQFSHPQYYKTRSQVYQALDMQCKAKSDLQMVALIEKKQQQQQQIEIKGWRRFD